MTLVSAFNGVPPAMILRFGHVNVRCTASATTLPSAFSCTASTSSISSTRADMRRSMRGAPAATTRKLPLWKGRCRMVTRVLLPGAGIGR